MTRTEQLSRPVGRRADEVAVDEAQKAVAGAEASGVVAAQSSEEAREMILWLIGRLRWERQLDSLRCARGDEHAGSLQGGGRA
jgi:hypothetical protein